MELISPKYRTRLIKEIASAIWKEFPTYQEAYIYIDGWHYVTSSWDGNMENFEILLSYYECIRIKGENRFIVPMQMAR
jgi:hypothetical protein